MLVMKVIMVTLVLSVMLVIFGIVGIMIFICTDLSVGHDSREPLGEK